MRTGIALLVVASALAGCAGASPTAAPTAPAATFIVATAPPTATPRVTVRPALTPRPTNNRTAVIVHIVGAIDDLQAIVAADGGAEAWILDEVAWLADPANGFIAIGQPLNDYLLALEPALQAFADDVDPGPALQAIIALRPAIAAMAPTAVGTPRPTPKPAKPIVFKGKGRLNTKPFSLAAGDYTVTITGTGDGNVMAELTLRDRSDYVLLFNEISYGKYRYETIAYAVAAGSYYLDMDTDGPWTISLTPYR